MYSKLRRNSHGGIERDTKVYISDFVHRESAKYK